MRNYDEEFEDIASRLKFMLYARLKPGHENEFEYWQACFDAARENPDAAFLQTKAAAALTELLNA